MENNWKEEVLEAIRAELEAMEGVGEEPRNIFELEQLTIKMSQKAGKKAFEAWTKARAKKASFSP